MPFEFRDSMINDYWSLGYVVFKRILPGSLLRDLRVEADKCRALAHELNGPQIQRLQPVSKYADKIGQKPFQDYADLAPLRDAIQKLLGPTSKGATVRHTCWPDVLGLLIEPQAKPRHHGWHRDFVSDVPIPQQQTPERIKKAEGVMHGTLDWNQVNCAIYPDPCLWYVPGSHNRIVDLPGEKQNFDYFDKTAKTFDHMEGSDAELEQVFLEHAYNFPGAIRVYLDPGDFMVYRNIGWHTGLYNTYTPLATIHDGIKMVWNTSDGKQPA